MAIDINKIIDNALANSEDNKGDDKKDDSTMFESTKINFFENEDLMAVFEDAERLSFAAGLGALNLRDQFKRINEGVQPKKSSLKKKIGIGVGAGLAAAGAGYAAYKNKDQLQKLANQAGQKISGAAEQIKQKFGAVAGSAAKKAAAGAGAATK